MNRALLEQSFIAVEDHIRALDPHLIRKGIPGKFERLLYGFRRYGFKACRYIYYLSPSIIPVQTFFGKTIHINIPENIHVSFFGALPGSEIGLTRFLMRELKEDSVFYDIGAQIGFFSLLAHEIITTGEIHAFEANPRTFSILESNLPFATLNQSLVADSSGSASFYADLRGSSGTSSAKVINTTYTKITVESVTLDEYVTMHPKPTIAKIDVEGFEYEVVRGGTNALRDTTLIMEIWNDPEHIHVAHYLIGEGYGVYAIADDGSLSPFSAFESIRGLQNLVFKREVAVAA